MKLLAVMNGAFKLRARRVGVGGDKKGDCKLLNLAARIFITALKCAASVQSLLTVTMTSAESQVQLALCCAVTTSTNVSLLSV
jgi:hypothetical protein